MSQAVLKKVVKSATSKKARKTYNYRSKNEIKSATGFSRNSSNGIDLAADLQALLNKKK